MNKFIEFLKERSKNIQFYIRIVLISFLPILAYFGMTGTDLTSWAVLGDTIVKFFSNPYLLGLYIITLYQSFKNTGTKELGESE